MIGDDKLRFTDKIKGSRAAKKQKAGKIKAMRLFTVGFISVIALGTALLMLPFSVQNGVEHPGLLASLFTATSATCVTGLAVVDTATTWSIFGQAVILCMIQLGGIGFMTFAVLIAKIVKKMLSPKDRMLVAMSYNLNSYADVGGILKSVAIGTAVAESVGAILLFVRFAKIFPIGEAIFKSIFTSVSAFCNAGFDLMGDFYAAGAEGTAYASSMGYFIDDPFVCLTLSALVIVGGIGFAVWFDIKEKILRKKRLSAYTKFVLIISAVLFLGGTVLVALLEWNNGDTIGTLSAGGKLIASFFHSVSLRTAGFSSFNNGEMGFGTQILSLILMFIGGASGSTAGGVKVVTVGVLVYTIFCNMIGKNDAILFNRRISPSSFIRAASVIFVQLFLILASSVAIFSLSSDIGAMDVIYEVTSAVSTVGNSTGITASLGIAPKIILIFLMYFGRVGILTVTYALMINQSSGESTIRYPDADLLIG